MSLGRRIQKTLATLGMTQAEAARICGLSAQRFGHYVNDKRNPDLRTLLTIARGLKVTPDVLLGIKENQDADTEQILNKVLELEGIPSGQAARIAKVASNALKLIDEFRHFASNANPADLAAHAVWLAAKEN